MSTMIPCDAVLRPMIGDVLWDLELSTLSPVPSLEGIGILIISYIHIKYILINFVIYDYLSIKNNVQVLSECESG